MKSRSRRNLYSFSTFNNPPYGKDCALYSQGYSVSASGRTGFLFLFLFLFFLSGCEQSPANRLIYGPKQADLACKISVFIGDSITYGLDWQKALNRPAMNYGIGGDTTRGILQRLDSIPRGTRYFYFVMIGINDVAKEYPTDEIIENYKNIILRLKSFGSGVCVSSTLYENGDGVGKEMRPEIDRRNKVVFQIDEEIKRFCALQGVVYIDLIPVMCQNGDLLHSVSYDGTHLSEQGYNIWLDEIKKI